MTETIQSAKYVILRNFLSEAERSNLLNYVLTHETDFVPTTTSTGAIDYRKSKILYSFPEVADLMMPRIQSALFTVFAHLPAFQSTDIEMQLTAHNDGNYYKIHNDNGSAEVANRALTYVFYFYREPKGFSGGELRLYDSKIENGFYQCAKSFREVVPENNSIIFFQSHAMHEVMPVNCRSQEFADSRFTINGWIRR
jgi:SM-20-related protein